AHALGEQLLALAQQVQDTAMFVAGHRAFGTTLLWLGAVAAAPRHFSQSRALYDPQQHYAYAFLFWGDGGVVCGVHVAWTLWILGYPDQALTRTPEAVTLAQQRAHPYSLGFALSAAAMFHQLRREVRCTQERAEAAMILAQEQGFQFWMASASLLRGWV